jgi:hypothetical protein
MKTNHKETYIYTSTLTSFLRYANTRNLAVVMFIFLGLLSITRGKESEARRPASAKATTTRVRLDDFTYSPQKTDFAAGCEGKIEPAR